MRRTPFRGLVSDALVSLTRRSTRGATAVEYAVMASLIAVVIVLAVTLLGSSVSQLFQSAATSV